MSKRITLQPRSSFSDSDREAYDFLYGLGPDRITYMLTLLKATFTSEEMKEPNECILKINSMYISKNGLPDHSHDINKSTHVESPKPIISVKETEPDDTDEGEFDLNRLLEEG